MANNTSKIDDLVALLDQFVTSGSGHINVTNEADDTKSMESDAAPSVDTKKSNECTPNMACSVPTLQQSVDGEEEPTI